VAAGLGAGHGGSRSVVVDDADFGRVSIGPAEHDAPLVIQANRVEPPQVALQSLQPIARRDPEILDAGRRIEDQALSERDTPDLLQESLQALSAEEVSGATVGKTRNHASEQKRSACICQVSRTTKARDACAAVKAASKFLHGSRTLIPTRHAGSSSPPCTLEPTDHSKPVQPRRLPFSGGTPREEDGRTRIWRAQRFRAEALASSAALAGRESHGWDRSPEQEIPPGAIAWSPSAWYGRHMMTSALYPAFVVALLVATVSMVSGCSTQPPHPSTLGAATSMPPSVLKAGQDRNGTPHTMGRGTLGIDAKISTADTEGAIFLWEITVAEKSGPPRHVHYYQDEWFFVVQGEFVAEIGGTMYFLLPGDSILLPRGVTHAYAHVSDGVGKMLAAVFPAQTFEQFLEESRLAGPKATPKEIDELFQKHGMKEVGPPIDVASLKRASPK